MGWRLAFAARQLSENLAAKVRDGGHDLIEIPTQLMVDEEVAHLRMARTSGWDLVLVDHYGLGEIWHRQAASLGHVIAAVDDLASERQHVALLVNQNLGFNAEEYQDLVPSDCELLLGPTYAMLRPEFKAMRGRTPRVRRQLSRVLIFLSGGDPDAVTTRVVEALLPLGIPADVVIGAANPDAERLTRLASDHRSVTIYRDTDRIANLMAHADLAIGAPGSSSWERCALGLPAILVILAPNQARLAAALEQAGAATVLGWQHAVTGEQLASAVEMLRTAPSALTEMSSRAAALCDGRGARRVADALERIVNSRLEARTPSERTSVRARTDRSS